MTIHDLEWKPASIGEGMIAVQQFADGITVCLRFEHDAYNFTSFDGDRRVLENRQGITREEANRLLNGRAFLSAFQRA